MRTGNCVQAPCRSRFTLIRTAQKYAKSMLGDIHGGWKEHRNSNAISRAEQQPSSPPPPWSAYPWGICTMDRAPQLGARDISCNAVLH